MCIQGHIYKIIHLDSNITYIGSTCDSISGRWRTHKSGYKNWLNDKEKYNPVAIYPYFEKYSIDRFKMILIKSYDVYDKHQLKVYEQLVINRTKCVNTNAAMQLISVRCMVKHFNILRSVKDKLYREANKQSINERGKEYYQANKDKILVKVTCECGAQIRKSCLARHRKSAKCIALLAALSHTE